MLELKNITKIYGTNDNQVVALKDINLTFRQSEFVCILGPSGCGKTTMLNIVGGLDRYTEGDLVINGTSTKEYTDRNWDSYRNHSVGFVFQSYNLIPHLSVLNNVELALTLEGASKTERLEKAKIALEKVGLLAQINKKPNQLSGGQMQRVAIARALVNDPDIILADEPTGALDTETGIQVIDLLKEVANDRLVVMVTHNDSLAEKYATRIIQLLDGVVTQDSHPYHETSEQESKPTSTKKVAMSLFTAFMLSIKNLLSKKGRTLLTSFAGSIGIFGICMVLAISNGMNGYVTSVQQNTMGDSPISISQSALSTESVLRQLGAYDDLVAYPENTTGVYPYEPPTMSSFMTSNTITDSYVEYVEAMDPSLVMAVQYTRGVSMNLITENGGRYTRVSTRTAGWQEMVDSTELVSDSYDILAGSKLPTAYDEVAIVIDQYNRLSTTMLTALGISYDGLDEIDYDTFLSKEFKLILNDEYYTLSGEIYRSALSSTYSALYESEEAVTLKVVSILRPTKGSSVQWLSSGLAYTTALTDYVLQDCAESAVGIAQMNNPTTNVRTGVSLNPTGLLSADQVEESWTTLLQQLGAIELPTAIDIYPSSFDAKDEITAYLDAWNDTHSEEEQIVYTDYTEMVFEMMSQMIDIISYILIAFSAISLVVSSIMISITTYASVVERTKEIGVLRSLGARKKDISRIFNAETVLIGITAGLIGVILTLLLSIPINAIINNLTGISSIASLNWLSALIMIAISTLLTLVAGLIPARIAAKKDPVVALRTE